MPTPHRSSATPLAWRYVGLIVYASLSPFSGWRVPTELPHWGLTHLPWLRAWIGFDVVSNLVGYVPLGALVFGALVRSGVRGWPAALLALTAGALLSLLLEITQNFLPQRVPSRLDWLLNAAGALLGVLLAVLVRAWGGVERWQVLRDRWFIARSAGGIVLLLAWPLGLLFPTPVPLGMGQVLEHFREGVLWAFEGTPWWAAAQAWLGPMQVVTPLSRGGESLATALGLLAPCLVAFAVVPHKLRRVAVVLLTLALGFLVSTLSTALNFGPQHALAWLTPTALPSMAVGAVMALLLVRLPLRAAAGLGLVVLTLLVALVSQAPADPYHALSLQAWEQGRFIRFHGAAQWVGWLWPYVALAYLLGRGVARDDPPPQVPQGPSAPPP